jgi:hypothetical protein
VKGTRNDFSIETVKRRVTVDAQTGCWVWQGALVTSGYGMVSVAGRDWRTHRLAWATTHGPIPSGLLVCHHCDNPPCCNPDHLFLGTVQDNADDAVRKGRTASGDRNISRLCPERRPRGEKQGLSVLTEGAVKAIRHLNEATHPRRRDLAVLFGVSQATVQQVVTYKTWRHL